MKKFVMLISMGMFFGAMNSYGMKIKDISELPKNSQFAYCRKHDLKSPIHDTHNGKKKVIRYMYTVITQADDTTDENNTVNRDSCIIEKIKSQNNIKCILQFCDENGKEESYLYKSSRDISYEDLEKYLSIKPKVDRVKVSTTYFGDISRKVSLLRSNDELLISISGQFASNDFNGLENHKKAEQTIVAKYFALSSEAQRQLLTD